MKGMNIDEEKYPPRQVAWYISDQKEHGRRAASADHAVARRVEPNLDARLLGGADEVPMLSARRLINAGRILTCLSLASLEFLADKVGMPPASHVCSGTTFSRTGRVAE